MGDVSQEEAEAEAVNGRFLLFGVGKPRGFVGLGVGGRCGRRECGQKKKTGQERGLEEKGGEAGKSLRCAPGFEGALI